VFESFQSLFGFCAVHSSLLHEFEGLLLLFGDCKTHSIALGILHLLLVRHFLLVTLYRLRNTQPHCILFAAKRFVDREENDFVVTLLHENVHDLEALLVVPGFGLVVVQWVVGIKLFIGLHDLCHEEGAHNTEEELLANPHDYHEAED